MTQHSLKLIPANPAEAAHGGLSPLQQPWGMEAASGQTYKVQAFQLQADAHNYFLITASEKLLLQAGDIIQTPELTLKVQLEAVAADLTSAWNEPEREATAPTIDPWGDWGNTPEQPSTMDSFDPLSFLDGNTQPQQKHPSSLLEKQPEQPKRLEQYFELPSLLDDAQNHLFSQNYHALTTMEDK